MSAMISTRMACSLVGRGMICSNMAEPHQPLRTATSLIALLVLLGAAVAAAPDAAKDEMAKLEGSWSMVSGQADGQPMPAEMVKTGKRVAKDGQTTITFGGQLYFKAKF